MAWSFQSFHSNSSFQFLLFLSFSVCFFLLAHFFFLFLSPSSYVLIFFSLILFPTLFPLPLCLFLSLQSSHHLLSLSLFHCFISFSFSLSLSLPLCLSLSISISQSISLSLSLSLCPSVSHHLISSFFFSFSQTFIPSLFPLFLHFPLTHKLFCSTLFSIDLFWNPSAFFLPRSRLAAFSIASTEITFTLAVLAPLRFADGRSPAANRFIPTTSVAKQINIRLTLKQTFEAMFGITCFLNMFLKYWQSWVRIFVFLSFSLSNVTP